MTPAGGRDSWRTGSASATARRAFIACLACFVATPPALAQVPAAVASGTTARTLAPAEAAAGVAAPNEAATSVAAPSAAIGDTSASGAALSAAATADPAEQDTQRRTLSVGDIAIATGLRDSTLAGSEAYLIAESLTTEVGPRMAGSANDARAVAWAQAKFTELGFDRVWLQSVSYPKWVRRSEHAEVLAPYPQPLHVRALGYSSGTDGTPIEAEVVEFTTLAALQAADAEDVRGRIVFIGNRMQRRKDGGGYGVAVAARSGGADAAARLGAVALLIRSIGTDDTRLPHTGMGLSLSAALADAERVATAPRSTSGIPLVETPIPAAALSNPDADLLSHMLERSQPVRLRLALDVGLDGEAQSHNVIAEVTGSTRADEILVAGAHLDSWDLGTGALDDAAGIGITAGAAFAIHKLGHKPARTIRVVAFANEEQGIWGGRAYAEEARRKGEKHVLVGESDFGAGRVYALSAGVGADAEALMREIAAVLAPIGVEWSETKGGAGADVTPLVTQGVPWFSLAQDGSTYFDHHHTDNDTLDKIDKPSLDQNVAAWAALLWLAASADVDFGRAPTPVPVPAPAPTAESAPASPASAPGTAARR